MFLKLMEASDVTAFKSLDQSLEADVPPGLVAFCQLRPETSNKLCF